MPTNADPQDGRDAAARARRGYRGDGWHPILSLVESDSEPAVFHLGPTVAGHIAPRYELRVVAIGGERGWRVVTWALTSADRELVGYRTSLRGAAELAHTHMLRTAGGQIHAEGPAARWDSPDAATGPNQPR